MEQRDGDEPPADRQHHVSNGRGAALDDQIDQQQKAQKRGDDQPGRDTSRRAIATNLDGHSSLYHPAAPAPIRERAASHARDSGSALPAVANLILILPISSPDSSH